ncbi:acyl-CoA synthetase [Pallidibacillus pasinlerensis]|uniref:Acyl--CoA ligase n=1 Tax=Pallidibacillus pasinlerensis TaxID=2703818 RepID=A0ABX0A2S5_9BACI|nr:acyl--CoA ligase [Pallidibacillus pasinlerensis]NCU17132.1 acyl--CoA ligase [Pallidibacillus pasinlerensis]
MIKKHTVSLEDLMAPNKYNIVDDIERHYSDKIALRFLSQNGEREEITYKEFIARGNKLANALKKIGLKKGDRVFVMVPRMIESYIIYYACWKNGLVIIPASELLRANDILYRLNNSQAKAVIAFADLCEEVDKVANDANNLQIKITFTKSVNSWLQMEELVEGESEVCQKTDTKKTDPLLISYTSGTTGQPKGVVHVHSWAYAHLRIAAPLWLDIHEDDIVWATAGPGWQKWVWSPFVSVLGIGATGFVYLGKFKPETYLTLLEQEQINVLCCTPTEYRLMAKVEDLTKYDLTKLHSAVSAGEALNREVIDVFQNKFNITVRDGYGQTESTLVIGTVQNMDIRIGSMGKPILPEFVAIVDDEGNPLGPDEKGNIALRKDFPALFASYYEDPERTAKAFKGNYFVTGDLAYRDADNYYWFVGRSDDMIISSGYTIGPFEVEDALMKHQAVKECAVVAEPDEIRGNIVKAFVVLKDGITGSDELVKELQDFVKKLTAPYKYPRKIEFAESLPKTDSGKIRRVELRNRNNA